MAENRTRGLGRGLSALLGEVEDIAHAVAPDEGVREIPIELVHRNPAQPRQVFDEAELAELEASIRASGVLQPILVRPSAHARGEFEIVAGERRWRAAQRAGLATVPALVRTLADDEAYTMAIVENVQRSDLNPMEEARAYLVLLGKTQKTQEELATIVGKSRSHIANTVRLAQLPEPVQEHLMAGRLSAGHGRALLSAEDPVGLAAAAVSRQLSVREVEALARQNAAAPKKASGPRRVKDADTEALEADLEEALGMAVDIADRGGAGEVRIRYASLEQLDDVCRRLTRR